MPRRGDFHVSENRMSDMIKASIEGVKDFAGTELSVGNVIETPSGVTVIPISRVNVGFATGGLDYGQKKLLSDKNFGGGGGTGISVTPVAFLCVGKDAEVTLHHIGAESGGIDRIISLVEHSPEIIEKIKNMMM